jgi:hypothetical protein
MRLTIKLAALLPLMFFWLATNAPAQLVQGPVNPANGFPQFIQSPGVAPGDPILTVELCLTNPLCSNDPVVPGNLFSQTIGFGKQVYYWRGVSDIGQLATLEMGVRTGWGGTLANGNQRVVNFIRIDLRDLPRGGTYKVVHPYGTETFNVTADAAGRFNVDFKRSTVGLNLANGPVTKFMVAQNAPAGFLGDSNTPAPATGAPLKNVFKIVGPVGTDLGGTLVPHKVKTNLFTIEGQLVP